MRERQYFEIFTNRAIFDKGWIACAQHTFPWRQDLVPGNWENDKRELYNLDADFSEANNLAAVHPDKLAEMKALFDEEAKTNNVYPFDDRGAARVAVPKPPPGGSDPNRTKFTYYAGAVPPMTGSALVACRGCRKPPRQTPRTGRIVSVRS